MYVRTGRTARYGGAQRQQVWTESIPAAIQRARHGWIGWLYIRHNWQIGEDWFDWGFLAMLGQHG